MSEERRDEQDRIIVPRTKYIELQIEEMLGGDNRHYTIENLCLTRSPTVDEKIENYIDHGGADNFARRYIPEDALECQS
jgi:hypothetical protein